MSITEQRSGIASDNYQEVLDAESNTGMSAGKSEQYFTPDWLVDYCQSKLPNQSPATIFDPQCGTGNLLTRFGYGSRRFGIELDNRVIYINGVHLITGNCLKVFEAIDDLYPDMRFVCINANPPFGRHWKRADGFTIESTAATWQFATKRGNMGYFIASDATIQKLGIHKHPWVYGYETKPAIDIWKNMRAELQIGIVWWQRPQDDQYTYTSGHQLTPAWDRIRKIIDEEKAGRPDYNIYLDENGLLRTYLSIRQQIKMDKSP